MSSVSNFEMDKPRQTYAAIKAMKAYINKSSSPSLEDKKELKRLIKNIETNFLEGK